MRGAGTRVAVLDTGLATDHPTWRPNVVDAVSFVPC